MTFSLPAFRDDLLVMGVCRVIAAVATLILVHSARADARLKIAASYENTPVRGARVCVFPGRDGDRLFDQFLMSDDVRCVSADEPLQLPIGFWNYFVEYGDRAVSSHPHAFIVPKDEAPNVFHGVQVQLVPAATLRVANAVRGLRKDEYFALYLGNESRPASRPSIRPVPANVNSVLVPAGMLVTPLRVFGEDIVAVGKTVTLAAGASLELSSPRITDGRSFAVLSIDDSFPSDEKSELDGVEPPTVVAEGSSIQHRSSASIRPAPLFDPSLIFFDDLPVGKYVLRLEGEMWASDEVVMAVDRDPAIAPRPTRRLVARPRAPLDVKWSVGAAVDQSLPICGAGKRPTSLRLRRCVLGFDRVRPGECDIVASVTIAGGSAGTETFARLREGSYYVELEAAGIVERRQVIVTAGRAASATLAVNPRLVSGICTLDGEPYAASIEFRSGLGTADSATGEYRALVTAPPLQNPIYIHGCTTGDEYLDIPGRELQEGDRYDIHLTSTTTSVQVIDARSHSGLANVLVSAQPLTAENTIAASFLGATGIDGVLEARNLSPAVSYQVCAATEGYTTACREIHPVAGRQTTTLELSSNPRQRIKIAGQAVGLGAVFFVESGVIKQQAPIDSGGTFEVDPDALRGANLILASQLYPLTLLALPDLSAPTPIISLPQIRGIELAVTLPVAAHHAGGPLALTLDGTLVPRRVLNYYETLRNRPLMQIRPNETIHLAPVSDISSIEVLLGHWQSDLPAYAHVEELFRDPSLGGFVWRSRVSAPEVIFTPR